MIAYASSESNHWCRKKIKFGPSKDTVSHDDSLISCHDAIWKIQKLERLSGMYTVQKFETSDWIVECPHLPSGQLNFGLTGVYTNRGLIPDSETFIHASDINGKVVEVGNILVTVPIDVIQVSI